MDLLKEADRAMLIAYCETWDLYMTAVLKVRAEGMTVINPESGFERKHPLVGVVQETAGLLRTLAREFGLTPAAEHAISKVPSVPDSDEDTDPFAGKTTTA
jgi:P27 family predicted phage terminase small subunit